MMTKKIFSKCYPISGYKKWRAKILVDKYYSDADKAFVKGGEVRVSGSSLPLHSFAIKVIGITIVIMAIIVIITIITEIGKKRTNIFLPAT